MRILFLTPLFPYPCNSGGLIKTWTLVQFLKELGALDVLCFRRGELSAEQHVFASDFPGRLQPLPLNRERGLTNLLRSYAAGVPLSIYRNYSQEMVDLVQAQLSLNGYDVLFVDHWLMAQYLPSHFTGRIILHLHNAESLIWQRQVALERNPLRKLFLALEYGRVRRYESSILTRFHQVFVVSEPDRQAILALGALREQIGVLPNLPHPKLLEEPALDFSKAPPNVLYLGTLSWQPNIQGLRSFLDTGFPLLHRQLPEIRLILAGSEPPRWLRQFAQQQPSVELVTPAVDEEGLYRKARVFLEPVRGGGGTKVKVLNALARGLPVVATPDGIEGIEAVDGEHLLVARDPPEMVAIIQGLCTDQDLWRRLSRNGRQLIHQHFQPEIAYRPLKEILSQVA